LVQATRKSALVASTTGAEAVGFVGFARGAREGVFIGFLAVALFLLLSFSSYDPGDPGWSFSGGNSQIANQGGVVGAWFSDVFLYLFGYLAYLFPLLIIYGGLLMFQDPHGAHRLTIGYLISRGGGFAMALAGGSALATLHYGAAGSLPLDAGGILGNVVGNGLVSLFNFLGATLFLLALFLTGVTLFLNLSWLALMDRTGHWALRIGMHAFVLANQLREKKAVVQKQREREVAVQRKRKAVTRTKPVCQLFRCSILPSRR
jgi:S-DNA-T family DNA segregation ATPase FtsK/SpoIIIE